MIYGYLRVSTRGQRPDRQIRGLEGLCDRLYLERFSAATVKDRPVFNEVVDLLEEDDTFYIWDLDRAFRNVEDAVYHAKMFKRRGIRFKAADAEIDISTGDKYHAYVSNAAAAERDRMKTSERTIEGLREARARGVILGRPPKMTVREIRSAKLKLETKSASIGEIAALYDVAPLTVTRSIKRVEGDFC